MNYKLLHQILNEAELFEKKYNRDISSLNDFRNFLNEIAYQKEKPLAIKVDNKESKETMLNNEICKMFIMMGRYAKIALKKGLVDFDELINEDFTYLYRLSDYPFLTKQQLIEKNGHNKQYGTIIIKRLLKHGLIDEKQDQVDKRQMNIHVTEKGKKLIDESFPSVTKVSEVITGNLTLDEKNDLLKLLKKLNNFHKFLYEFHRDEDLDEIIKEKNNF